VPLVPVPIKIDVELGRIAEVVSGILERRANRELKFWADLEDDLEAIGVIITQFDRLYVELLEDIQWRQHGSNDEVANRQQLIEQIHHFQHADELVAQLVELHGRVEVASQLRDLLPWKYRQLRSALRGLDRAIESYLQHMGDIREGDVPVDSKEKPLWNLATVLQCLESGENASGLSLRELCEEAISNRRLDLVLAVRELIGQATQRLRRQQL
jgi:hypothetical protein